MADIADLAIRARTQGVKKADRELGGLQRAAGKTRRTVTALGAAFGALSGTGGAIVAVTNQVAKAARETQNMADIANVSVEQLQRMSLASREVGVSQGQLSQILLDTQDRIGDFLATGGGEFQEFFERIAPQVGLTAEKLAQMSGPDALMAMYDALEQANLSASETRFYMESLASDSSRLIPLLKNNAEGFRESAERADEMNAVLSETETQNLSDLSDTLGEIRTQIDAKMAKSVEENAEAIETLARGMANLAEFGLDAVETVSLFGESLGFLAGRIVNGEIVDSIGQMEEKLSGLKDRRSELEEEFEGKQDLPIFQNRIEDLNSEIDMWSSRLEMARNHAERFSEPVSVASLNVRTLSEEMELLGGAFPDFAEASQGVSTLSEEFRAIDEALDESLFRIASDGLQDIRDQVSPGRAELREYREQLELLDLAVEKTNLSREKAIRLQRQLNDQLSEQATNVRTTTSVEKDLAEAVDRVAERERNRGDATEQGTQILTESQSRALSSTSQMFGQMAQIAKDGGKDQFETYKRMAQAQAAISTAAAVANALATPAPWPIPAGLATTAGALGAVQIAQIENQEYSPRKTGGQVRAGESYMVGENGPEIVTMNGGGHVTPNHQINSGNSNNVTQVFQLSDNARRETRQQIMESAPMIRNMAKQAVIEAAQQGGSMSRAVGSRN